MGNVEAAKLLLSTGAAVDAEDIGGPGPQSDGKPGQKSSLRFGAPQKVFRA